MKKSVTVLLILVVLGVGAWFTFRQSDNPAANNNIATSNKFNKKRFSLTEPASLWVIANKHNQLVPKTYAPEDLVVPDIPLRLSTQDDEMKLRKGAAEALKSMYDAAKKDSLTLMVSSGFRSYNFQVGLYNRYVKQQGQAAADSQSARPGFSEHQTGWAVDVEPASRKCEVDTCFADTPEGKWVAANAYKYGFILRYPEGKQNITGYIYEPWHLRYVGTGLASELQQQKNATLEEFFGLEAAPGYL